MLSVLFSNFTSKTFPTPFLGCILLAESNVKTLQGLEAPNKARGDFYSKSGHILQTTASRAKLVFQLLDKQNSNQLTFQRNWLKICF